MTASLERIGDIGVIFVDHPPVNAISQAVRLGIINGVKEAEADEAIKAIVLTARGRTFMAGADITEFGKPPLEPQFPAVIEALENASKPVVAAIFGTALGGGLELALACHYRIADARAKVGLPEVKLGLLPGAGGTQRLPRVAGVPKALEMIVSGNPIGAADGEAHGIIDRIAKDDLTAEAVAYAQELATSDAPLKKARDIVIDASTLPENFFADFRKSIARKSRGYFAPEKCIQCVEAAIELPFDEGLKRERALFMECMASSQSDGLRHVFFAERQTSRIPGLDSKSPTRDIKKVGIIGAGTMGGGIGMNFLNAGIPVVILDMNDEGLNAGVAKIKKNYDISAERGRFTPAQVDGFMELLTPTTNYDDMADCDLIIEAVFENMDIKKKVFAELDRVAKKGAILATNTSYLNIDEIAATTSRPSDILGMHFFSPANVMKLLEIVRAKETANDVLLTVVNLAKTIRKVGVVAGVCHGFIGNRMLEGYGREAGVMLLEGATPEQIDKAMYDFGMPMGPFTMMDMAGMDIGYMLRQQFPADRFHPHAYNVNNRLVEMNRKGQKTGAGMYDYDGRKPVPSPVVAEIIKEEAEKAGYAQRTISDEEIVARCIYPMINEGALILEEGFAYRPGDIDIVYIYGYGFPPYRGGPMHYGDHVGLDKVLETIEGYAETYGDKWWKPAPLIKKLVAEGKSFANMEN